MKVDVVMCTWNSNKPYFVKCLNSIKREVPIHHFILVDRFSTDGTVETVKRVFPDAKIIKSNARLQVNRKLGIEQVDTEFFVSIDSDMELCNGWFKQIVNHLDSNTGAIQGLHAHAYKEHLTAWVAWSRNIQARFREAFRGRVAVATSENPDVIDYAAPGYTLFRTCSVKDYDPPAIISSTANLLLRCVVRKGYVWKSLRDQNAIHYAIVSLNDWTQRARWGGAGLRLGNMSIWCLIRESLKETICALFASLRTRQPMILPYIALRQLGRIQGWVNWTKYVDYGLKQP